MNKYLAISLSVVMLVLGMGFGFMLSPYFYPFAKAQDHSQLFSNKKTADIEFINEMIAHHQSALVMAEQGMQSDKPEIKSLSENIILDQSREIDTLYELKKQWFNDEVQIEAMDSPNLGVFDANFNLRFLNAMIMHHEEAIMMSKSILNITARSEIIEIAQNIIQNQTNEVKMMMSFREDWYPGI